ncbi:MAG TPA: hypothetical protein VJ110_01280 [Candidatus Nanoarchaeia archaeon]|nr:hypothetical protein [Candidatus Nanoarchaeia archaeon]
MVSSALDAEEKRVNDLEKRVLETEKGLKEIQDFVGYATVHAGEMTHHVEHSDRSEVTWVLNGFYDFDFKHEHGEHTIYGNDTYVWYKGKQVVQFHEEPGGENRYAVTIYEKGPWEDEFKKLNKNTVDNFAKEKKEAEAKEKAERERQTNRLYELEAKERKLKEKAGKLLIE